MTPMQTNKAVRHYKLDSKAVELMRALNMYNKEAFSCCRLGKMFNVSYQAAWMAVTRKSWDFVPTPSEDDAIIIARGYLGI